MTASLQTTIRDLHRPRGRERRGLTLAEGVRLVEEALTSGVEITGAVVSTSLQGSQRGRALEAALREVGVPIEGVTDGELAKLAETDHPQGIVAVVKPRTWALADIDLRPARPALVLDGVQDPGNVGTMLRTALGMGAAGVMALPGTAELTNPKVVRGSMGALFRLPAVAVTDAAWHEWVRAAGATIWVAAMAGAPVHREPVTGLLVLVVGNEGAGVRPEIAAAGKRVAIPLAPGAESLNVAVAAGILLYEVTRER